MTEQAASQPTIAYFSMEIGLDPAFPTYSGGLGILAGDSLRAAADLRLPMVAITLVHRSGYFQQRLDARGRQTEEADAWVPEDHLEEMPQRTSVEIEGRTVHLRAWRFMARGIDGNPAQRPICVYLLDSSLEENSPQDRHLTDELYGGDARYRLSQEVVLGIGGVRMLRALGYGELRTYHMNEGHSGLLIAALLEERLGGRDVSEATPEELDAVRRQCVFTVHTPVPAGHDTFPVDLVAGVLGAERMRILELAPWQDTGMFDLTAFAMHFCRSANGVSMRHGQISRDMFPSHDVGAVTNGVHAGTWVAPAFAGLFDRHIPGWRRDTRYLRYVTGIPAEDVRHAHQQAKDAFLEQVERITGRRLDPGILTIGFARRATGYKRGDLLFTDAERLRRMSARVGPMQVVYSGKAHPRDESGKAIIQNIYEAAAGLKDILPVVYLEDYGMEIASYLVSGTDLWLNNPQKPLEASGTSGMKAAINGVPSLSVLDGWWVEGHIEGVTGWAIGDENSASEADEVASLYDKLEYAILPMYYGEPHAYDVVRRSCIAINGDFFSAQRMMDQYHHNVYTPAGEGS